MQDRPRTSPLEAPAPVPQAPEGARDVYVVGLGHRRVDGDASIFWDNARRALPDSLPYCLLQYTIQGSGRFAQLGRREDVTAGKAFLTVIPSPTQYGLERGRTWHWVWLAFRGDLARRTVERINARAGCLLELPVASTAVQTLFGIIDDATPGPIESAWDLSARTYAILMDLCERTLSDAGPAGAIQRAIARIARQLDDPALALVDLAQEAQLSRFHFLRKFKEQTGLTPARYLRQRRLSRGMDLLTLSDLPVKRVARMCGYRTSAHFCAAFRAHFGQTPGSIRVSQKPQP